MFATIGLWLSGAWIKLVAAVAIIALVFFLGWSQGSSRKQHSWDLANAKALTETAKQTADLAEQAAETDRIKNAAYGRVLAERDAAIDSLRNRPARIVSRPATATCAGSTGRELSREDAEFLTRLAADAQHDAANLVACYSREDEYRKAMIGTPK